ncbi:MAG: RepB family plasmid replication initiator protein [Candidatus Electrothrix sp. GM3_4]|nr:RepB family plasmid replication initiator protein [Candidatus Electrothrix sp. GM3_4]
MELRFDPNLKPYLLNLKKNFLSCDFQTLLSFGSIYTIRIFLLLLSQYKKY